MQRISIYSGHMIRFSLADKMAAIKAVGFDSVCLNFNKKQEGDGVWEYQVKLAYQNSLPIENVHLLGKGMSSVWRTGEEGESVTRRVVEDLRRTSLLGIGTAVTHVTWSDDQPEQFSDLALQRFSRMAEAAERYHVRLALENAVHPSFEHYILEHIQSPWLGFCYDSGHENLYGTQAKYLQRYGSRLFAMHLHDNDGNQDQHLPPFLGTICWEDKIPLLKKTALFPQLITLEAIFPHENIEEGYAQCFAAAKKLARM